MKIVSHNLKKSLITAAAYMVTKYATNFIKKIQTQIEVELEADIVVYIVDSVYSFSLFSYNAFFGNISNNFVLLISVIKFESF